MVNGDLLLFYLFIFYLFIFIYICCTPMSYLVICHYSITVNLYIRKRNKPSDYCIPSLFSLNILRISVIEYPLALK